MRIHGCDACFAEALAVVFDYGDARLGHKVYRLQYNQLNSFLVKKYDTRRRRRHDRHDDSPVTFSSRRVER